MVSIFAQRAIYISILHIWFVLLGFRSVSQQPVRDTFVRQAEAQVGVREATGNNDGKEVETYLRSVGLSKGYAWCAAFVSWLHIENNIPNPKSAWSPDWAEGEQVFYRKNGLNFNVPVKSGSVFSLYFQSKKRPAHVGIIVHEDKNYYYTIEGNTNGLGSREGDGVYKKKRSKKSIYTIGDWITPLEE